MGVRGVMLLMLYPFLRKTGHSTNYRDMIVMWWGGLRGAVGLALALTIKRRPYTDAGTGNLFVFHVGGVAMLTLLVNATTCKYLVQYLGLTKKSQSYKDMLKQLEKRLACELHDEFEVLLQKEQFAVVERKSVQKYIPELETERNPLNLHEFLDKPLDVAAQLRVEQDTHEEIIDCDADHTPPEMLVCTRKVFYKMLRQEYWRMIDDHLLPPDSAAATQLLSSLDAADAVPYYPINDFHEVMKFICSGSDSESWWMAKMHRLKRHVLDGTGFGWRLLPVRRSTAVFDVYTIICCMDAHREAEKLLSQLHFVKSDGLWRAHQIVVGESARQVSVMELFLEENSIGKNLITMCRSKQMALCLLARQTASVKEWVEIGLICDADKEELLVNHESCYKRVITARADWKTEEHSDDMPATKPHQLLKLSNPTYSRLTGLQRLSEYTNGK